MVAERKSSHESSSRELINIIQTSTSREEVEKACSDLFDKYNPIILRFVLSNKISIQDAEEICMDVWTLAYQKKIFKKFSWNDLNTSDPLKTWLMSTTANLLRAFWRKQKEEQNLTLSAALEEFERHILYYEEYMDIDLLKPSDPDLDDYIGLIFEEAKKLLTDQEYKVIILTYFENKNASEIGLVLGIKPGTVRQCRYRSLAKLKLSLSIQY